MTDLIRAALAHLQLLHDHLGPKPAPSLREYAVAVVEGFRL